MILQLKSNKYYNIINTAIVALIVSTSSSHDNISIRGIIILSMSIGISGLSTLIGGSGG